MLPKVDCALDAVQAGVATSHIIDGRVNQRAIVGSFNRQGSGDTGA